MRPNNLGREVIPAADRADKFTHQFIAHETAHQWWGNIVAWRCYRDQWLSEGFAEYSGILYTGLRMNRDAKADLLSRLRSSLKDPPQTETGPGKGLSLMSDRSYWDTGFLRGRQPALTRH